MWTALERVHALYRAAGRLDLMEVDQVVTMTDLSSRRRLKTIMKNLVGNDPCQILKSEYMSSNTFVPAVNSASDSIMVISDLNFPNNIAYQNVIFKITFESLTDRNQYQIEARVYQILSEYQLPFVMQLYDIYECNSFVEFIESGSSELINSIRERAIALEEQHRGYYDFNKAQIIMIERGGGSSLQDAIHAVYAGSQFISDDDWIAIFFQVTFCLGFFEELGIMHHDLHLGNIWLDKTDQTVQYKLRITPSARPIVFTTSYIVKIYDFDHAAIVPTQYRREGKTNRLLESLCSQVGECNRMKKGRDYAQFCWWLYRASDIVPKDVTDIITQSVNNEFLNNRCTNPPTPGCQNVTGVRGTLSWNGAPCRYEQGRRSCQPYPTRPVVEMLSMIAASNVLADTRTAGHMLESVLELPSYAGPTPYRPTLDVRHLRPTAAPAPPVRGDVPSRRRAGVRRE